MMDYPISLRLKGLKCVVIGGGTVAERKIDALLDGEAVVHVVAPRISEAIRGKDVRIHEREYASSDIEGARVVIAATDSPGLNLRVAQEARASGILVNVVDEPELCDFFVPSVLRRGELTVAVSTGGHSPLISSHVRNKLQESIGPEYGRLTELAAVLRSRIREAGGGAEDVRTATAKLLSSRTLELLSTGDAAAAEREASLCM